MSIVQSAAAFVTDFADEAVVIPGAICVALVFAASGWVRGAIVWSIGLAATLGTMLVLKLGFTACGHRLGWSVESPSGHTAAAGVFYGTLLALAIRRAGWPARAEATVVAAAVTVVGLSRLVLGVHTRAEVCIGAAIGMAGAGLVLGFIGRPPPAHRRIVPLLLPALGLLCLLHGVRMPAEAAIRAAAHGLWPLTACREHDPA